MVATENQTLILEDEPTGKMIRLKHPEYVGLSYGPDADSAIVFGPRGQQPPGEAWIPDNHPLLPALMEAHPEVTVVVASGPAVIYVCPVHPDRQFKTQASLKAHFGAKGHSAADILALLAPAEEATGDPVSHDGVTSSPPAPVGKQGNL